jgi:hypothetical protein
MQNPPTLNVCQEFAQLSHTVAHVYMTTLIV